MANEDDGTSTLRADCTLYLYKSILEEETKEDSLTTIAMGKNGEDISLKKSLNMKVGGIAGIGATDAKADITIDKTKVHVGDAIAV